jgi:hypothetical protein
MHKQFLVENFGLKSVRRAHRTIEKETGLIENESVCVCDLRHNRPHPAAGADELRPLGVQSGEQFLARFIDISDARQINLQGATAIDRTRRFPTAFQFLDQRFGQCPFNLERPQLWLIVDRDSEHGRYPSFLSLIDESERREPYPASQTAVLEEQISHLDGPEFGLDNIWPDACVQARPRLDDNLLHTALAGGFDRGHDSQTKLNPVIHDLALRRFDCFEVKAWNVPRK